MKKLLPFTIIFYWLFATSCQKDASLTNNLNPSGGNLLVRYVSVWNDGTSPANDSFVTTYNYDAANKLIKIEEAGQVPVFYNRDAQERLVSITSLSSPGDTNYAKIFYTTTTSTQVAYVLYGKTSLATRPDSVVFTYTGTHVTKTTPYGYAAGSMQAGYYNTFAYDANGNVTQVQVFTPANELNIGYDFEYDDKQNPKYLADDAILPSGWGYISSPNNIKKQVNHYGNPPLRPDDYVTYTYLYNSHNYPVTGLHEGTAIGAQHEEQRFYYQ